MKDGLKQDKALFFIRDGGLKGITFQRLMEETNLAQKVLEAILKEALEKGDIYKINLTPPIYLHTHLIRELSKGIEEALKAFHDANPLREGMEKEVLRSQIAPDTDKRFWDHLLTVVCGDGKFVVEQDTVRLSTHRQSVDPAFQKTIEAVEESLITGGTKPPTLKDLSARLNKSPEQLKTILAFLTKEGKCVKLTEEIYMDTAAFEKIKEASIAFLKKNGELTVQSFKELTGLSRKFAVPILELFDKLRITIRIDQKRVLRG